MFDKTKTAETKIPKLGTGIVHHDTPRPPSNENLYSPYNGSSIGLTKIDVKKSYVNKAIMTMDISY